MQLLVVYGLVATVLLLLALVSGLKCAQQVLNVTFEHHEQLNLFKTNNPCHVAIIVAAWCSDCVNSKQTQQNLRQLALSKGWSVLNADVGTRAQFSDATNYMRSDPLYKVRGLPSLYAIINSSINYGVVDQQVYDQNMVNQLMSIVSNGPPASCNPSTPRKLPYPVLADA